MVLTVVVLTYWTGDDCVVLELACSVCEPVCRHTIVTVFVTFSGKVRVSTSVDDVTGWWYESSPNFAVVRGQSVSWVVAKFESSIIVDWCRRLSPSSCHRLSPSLCRLSSPI